MDHPSGRTRFRPEPQLSTPSPIPLPTFPPTSVMTPELYLRMTATTPPKKRGPRRIYPDIASKLHNSPVDEGDEEENAANRERANQDCEKFLALAQSLKDGGRYKLRFGDARRSYSISTNAEVSPSDQAHSPATDGGSLGLSNPVNGDSNTGRMYGLRSRNVPRSDGMIIGTRGRPQSPEKSSIAKGISTDRAGDVKLLDLAKYEAFTDESEVPMDTPSTTKSSDTIEFGGSAAQGPEYAQITQREGNVIVSDDQISNLDLAKDVTLPPHTHTNDKPNAVVKIIVEQDLDLAKDTSLPPHVHTGDQEGPVAKIKIEQTLDHKDSIVVPPQSANNIQKTTDTATQTDALTYKHASTQTEQITYQNASTQTSASDSWIEAPNLLTRDQKVKPPIDAKMPSLRSAHAPAPFPDWERWWKIFLAVFAVVMGYHFTSFVLWDVSVG